MIRKNMSPIIGTIAEYRLPETRPATLIKATYPYVRKLLYENIFIKYCTIVL